MTSSRDLDFAPLLRTSGSRARVRAATADNLMVMAGTVGVLLVIVPLTIFIALVATGNATDVGGLVVLAGCFGGGIYVFLDILRKSGGSASLESFARANDLVLTRATLVPHYRGSQFADESHAVRQSVRTKDALFVEVGDRFPTTTPRSRVPHRPQLFLRARLGAGVSGDPSAIVTPELDERLERFAGDYDVEVSGDELTLFGSEALDAGEPGRVEEAFALVDELVARADAAVSASPRPGGLVPTSAPTPSGIRVPAPAPQERLPGRRPGALKVVGWILAAMIVGPLAIAIVMSILDDHLRGNVGAARLVVSLIVLGVLVGVARIAKAAVTPRRTERSPGPDAEPD